MHLLQRLTQTLFYLMVGGLWTAGSVSNRQRILATVTVER